AHSVDSCSRTALHTPHSCPTRRSSDLVLAAGEGAPERGARPDRGRRLATEHLDECRRGPHACKATVDGSAVACQEHRGGRLPIRDRKSTRLNSSHVKSSYAVFCLKKKS